MEINSNKAMVELVRANPNDVGFIYASIELPLSKLQTQDALHRARWTSEDDGEYRELYFTNCPKLPGLVNMVINDATLREADFFAKRLEQLPLEELIALNAIVENNLDAGKYKDGVSMKELINQTYGLDVVMIASDVGNDEALGQFVIENELHEDVTSVPENAIYLLDKEKIGRYQRENDGGIFYNGFYVVAGEYELMEVYDGEPLPDMEESSEAVFRLEIGKPPCGDVQETEKNTLWIELPTDYKALQESVKENFGILAEKCVYYGFDTSIPMINEDVFTDMRDIALLNDIANRYFCMHEEDKIKFKAVLEAEHIGNMEQVLDVAVNVSEYELTYFCSDESEFFREHLLHFMDKQYDANWLSYLLVQTEGKELMKRLNAKCTDYGVVSARGVSLYSPVTVDEQITVIEEAGQSEEIEESQEMGGMSL